MGDIWRKRKEKDGLMKRKGEGCVASRWESVCWIYWKADVGHCCNEQQVLHKDFVSLHVFSLVKAWSSCSLHSPRLIRRPPATLSTLYAPLMLASSLAAPKAVIYKTFVAVWCDKIVFRCYFALFYLFTIYLSIWCFGTSLDAFIQCVMNETNKFVGYSTFILAIAIKRSRQQKNKTFRWFFSSFLSLALILTLSFMRAVFFPVSFTHLIVCRYIFFYFGPHHFTLSHVR